MCTAGGGGGGAAAVVGGDCDGEEKEGGGGEEVKKEGDSACLWQLNEKGHWRDLRKERDQPVRLLLHSACWCCCWWWEGWSHLLVRFGLGATRTTLGRLTSLWCGVNEYGWRE